MSASRIGVPRSGTAAVLALSVSMWLTACEGLDLSQLGRVLGPRQDTVAAGLREALEIGSQRAVRLASARGGFVDEPRLRIRLPRELEGMAQAMRRFGLRREVQQLELAMNRAAEQASGEALEVFLPAIRRMSFSDARAILAGSDTAATDYLRRTSSDALRERFEPIVDEKIHEAGLAQLYGDVMARLRSYPVPLPATPPLERYVTDRTLEGLFTLMGDEERRIRSDPQARSSELLRQVFDSPGGSR